MASTPFENITYATAVEVLDKVRIWRFRLTCPNDVKSPQGKQIWQVDECISGYTIWRNVNNNLFGKHDINGPLTLNEIQIRSFKWINKRSKKIRLDWHQRTLILMIISYYIVSLEFLNCQLCLGMIIKSDYSLKLFTCSLTLLVCYCIRVNTKGGAGKFEGHNLGIEAQCEG